MIRAIRTAALQKLQPSLEDVLSIAGTYEATTMTMAVIKESEKRALHTNAVYTQKSNHQKRNFSDGKGGKTALKSCSGCGHSHSRENFKFREAICHNCARKGYIAVVCLSKQCKDKKDTDQQKIRNKNAESIQTIYNVSIKTFVLIYVC